jgi:hypothetical protein
MTLLKLFLLQAPAVRDSLAEKEMSETLVQGASMVVMTVSLAAWFVAWRFFKIERNGKKYFFINAALAVIYLPFLVVHFFRCYAADFQTGTEHYLMFFFLHSLILVFWSLGFYGRHKTEEPF